MLTVERLPVSHVVVLLLLLLLLLLLPCRAIDRAGGLDRYLLKTPDSLLYSDLGSDLKFRIGLLYRHKWHEQRQQQNQQQQQQQQQLRLPGTVQAAADKAAAQLAGGGRRSRSLLPPAAAAMLGKSDGLLQ
jgi:hypothetical protein